MFSRAEADYRKAQAFSGNGNEISVSIGSKSVPEKEKQQNSIPTCRKKIKGKEEKCGFMFICSIIA